MNRNDEAFAPPIASLALLGKPGIDRTEAGQANMGVNDSSRDHHRCCGIAAARVVIDDPTFPLPSRHISVLAASLPRSSEVRRHFVPKDPIDRTHAEPR
jgi:hypothetical protein